jgi:hypothetical protein
MYRGVFETDPGDFEHLFNSPNIPHTTTVLQIRFYFPDPGKKTSGTLKKQIHAFTIFVTGICLKNNPLTSG